jgi:hypothetical protein
MKKNINQINQRQYIKKTIFNLNIIQFVLIRMFFMIIFDCLNLFFDLFFNFELIFYFLRLFNSIKYSEKLLPCYCILRFIYHL